MVGKVGESGKRWGNGRKGWGEQEKVGKRVGNIEERGKRWEKG